MTTTFYLVRHAAHGLLERVLTGRMPQVHLGEFGRAQAKTLADHFKSLGISSVHTSPRERAEETARPIAGASGVSCDVALGLDEIDIGVWTGLRFDELQTDPRWQAWNQDRENTRAPDGESMREAQARVIAHLRDSHEANPDARIVLVSHADVIKAAVLKIVGASLNAYSSMEISPAGISTVLWGDWGAKIISLNERIAA